MIPAWEQKKRRRWKAGSVVEITGMTLGVIGMGGFGREMVKRAAGSPLWDALNLLLTPHRAGASQHRPQVIVRFFQEQLARYLAGERPRNVIDKQRGY